jgi:hypothetical protein
MGHAVKVARKAKITREVIIHRSDDDPEAL